jgi:hypothetical protein
LWFAKKSLSFSLGDLEPLKRGGYNAGIKKEEILLVFYSLIRTFASKWKYR